MSFSWSEDVSSGASIDDEDMNEVYNNIQHVEDVLDSWYQYVTFNGTSTYGAISGLNYSTSGVISSMTVTAWVRVPSDGGDWSILDFDRSEYFTCAAGIAVGGNNGEGNVVSFQTHHTSAGTHDMWGNQDIRDNRWHHIAWVYDGTYKTIYVDGAEDEKLDVSGDGNIGSGTTRYGFIGDGSEASSFDGSKNDIYFEGDIASVTFWDNVALNQTEVQDAMSGHYKSGITGQWRFREGSGSTVSDNSGNGYDVTLYNYTWNGSDISFGWSEFSVEGTEGTPDSITSAQMTDLRDGTEYIDTNMFATYNSDNDYSVDSGHDTTVYSGEDSTYNDAVQTGDNTDYNTSEDDGANNTYDGSLLSADDSSDYSENDTGDDETVYTSQYNDENSGYDDSVSFDGVV